MQFVSLIFLFVFLPSVIILYYILYGRRKYQNVLLFVVSILFYAYGEPSFVLVLLLSIVINWALAILIEKNTNHLKLRKMFVAFAIICDIGLLFVYKYMDFCLAQVKIIGKINFDLPNIALPLGISFFSFQAMSYIFDVVSGEKAQRNLIYVGLYIAFFPQLVAGPIVRYESVAEQISYRRESLSKFRSGVTRFMQGYAKKVLIANTLAVIADKAYGMNINELSMSFAWLGALSYSFQIYFDFSGYSDMAIGLGRMFGFEFDENFRQPYCSTSITDFWRRWHISMGKWFRDYVYIPLGGNRTGYLYRNIGNLFIVWLLTGIWHGANWTFIVWGVLNFIFILIEKHTPFGSIIKKNKVLGQIYSFIVVNLLWVIFRSENMNQAIEYYGAMFGFKGITEGLDLTFIYFKENIVYLLVAICLSFGIVQKLSNKTIAHFDKNKRKKQFLTTIKCIAEIVLVIVFGISIVYVINGTYNPFIYFNF